jgi:hypothetical protein
MSLEHKSIFLVELGACIVVHGIWDGTYLMSPYLVEVAYIYVVGLSVP